MNKLLATFLTIVTAIVSAAAQPQRQRFDPAARARAIAPFVDESTFVIGHVDVARIDTDALVTRVAAFAKETDGVVQVEVEKGKAVVRTFRKRMIQAGGANVYAVFSLADMTADPPFFFVVPLRRGADAEAVCTLLRKGPFDPRPGPRKKPKTNKRRRQRGAKVRVVRGAAVWGAENVLQRIGVMKPHTRSGLAKAFAAAGDTTAQILILPTAATRRVLKDMHTHLPPVLGGGAIKPITQGFLWGAIGLNGPPRMLLKAVIQSPDAAAAQDLSQAVTGIYAAVARHKQVSQYLPQLKDLAGMLIPKATGDHLTLSLDHGKMDILLNSLVPGFRLARMHAKRALSASNLQSIGASLYMYANEHKDTFPETGYPLPSRGHNM